MIILTKIKNGHRANITEYIVAEYRSKENELLIIENNKVIEKEKVNFRTVTEFMLKIYELRKKYYGRI